MLEEPDLNRRAKLTLKQLSHELQMLEMKNEIQSKVKTDLDQQQREYFLNQQLKTIQEELVICNIGLPSQEFYQINDQPNYFYMLGKRILYTCLESASTVVMERGPIWYII